MELRVINLINKKQKQESTIIIVNQNDTVEELKNTVKKSLKLDLDSSRLGIFFVPGSDGKEERVYMTNDTKALRDYNLGDKMDISVKDLGPQIGYRFTYIVEYLGPLLIIAFYFFSYGPEKTNTTQRLVFVMSTFHYLKRILESIFVHEFSRGTMPLQNLFINCIYYWVIYGLVCGWSIFNESYTPPSWAPFIRYLFVFFFFSAEVKNLKCHLILRDLKKNNSGEKGIPHGEGFEFVSCANYFWEVLSWLCFSIFVGNLSCYLFTLFGFLIMKNWATKKHKDYIKTFGDRYPKNRKIIVPFIF